MPHHAREGVSFLWLADPVLQTIEVHRRMDGRWLLLDVHRAAAKVRIAPFEAVELDPRLLWEH